MYAYRFRLKILKSMLLWARNLLNGSKSIFVLVFTFDIKIIFKLGHSDLDMC